MVPFNVNLLFSYLTLLFETKVFQVINYLLSLLKKSIEGCFQCVISTSSRKENSAFNHKVEKYNISRMNMVPLTVFPSGSILIFYLYFGSMLMSYLCFPFFFLQSNTFIRILNKISIISTILKNIGGFIFYIDG